MGENGRLHHHAHRYEEHGAEQVFDGSDDVFDALGVARAGEDAAHDEGAEGKGEAAVDTEYGHAETQPHRHHKQGLAVEESAPEVEQRRQDVHAHQKPHDEEKQQFADAEQQVGTLYGIVDCDGRQNHHHHHGEKVFYNEHGKDERREFLLPKPHVGKCLYYYCGG